MDNIILEHDRDIQRLKQQVDVLIRMVEDLQRPPENTQHEQKRTI